MAGRLEEYRRLVEEIKSCRRCELHRYRRNPVPGEGPLDARGMLVGEAPGKVEDETGRPFVGAAGRLLTRLLEETGVGRGNVYITNVLKCRPPGNRDPRPEEVEACSPYLRRQIRIIEPRVVVCLGRHSARLLFSWAGIRWRSMSSMHGRVYDAVLEGLRVKLVATYHPAAALYNPRLRDSLERDFREVIAPLLRGAGGGAGRTLLDFMH